MWLIQPLLHAPHTTLGSLINRTCRPLVLLFLCEYPAGEQIAAWRKFAFQSLNNPAWPKMLTSEVGRTAEQEEKLTSTAFDGLTNA
jgi:hypothetical protein